MDVVDVQVHVNWDEFVETDVVAPWPNVIRRHVTANSMVAAMDEAGVAAALLTTPRTALAFDNSCALAGAGAHPDRFRVVGRVEPLEPGAADRVAAWAATPYAVGIRISMDAPYQRAAAAEGGFDAFLQAAAELRMPVSVLGRGTAGDLAPVAAANPDTWILVDHLGVTRVPPSADDEQLRQVLDLARFPNVAVKATRGAGLSTAPYPFVDVWPLLDLLLEAFGPDRLLWGSDWTTVANASYAEGVTYLAESDRLDADTKAKLLGGSARAIFGWPDDGTSSAAGASP